tara:strand:- start:1468 stop:1848 length:381 start_codon:yes stop_codon:yes gene_type:complete
MTNNIDTIFDHVTFNDKGLVPVIAQCQHSGEVLMMAWMNKEALMHTIETGQVCYYSRSRQALWRKGETSGHTQELVSLTLDCDGDTILAKVNQIGPACHTNRKTCFFKLIDPSDHTITITQDVQPA